MLCRQTCALAAVVCACALRAARASAEACATAERKPKSADPIAVHDEGRAFAARGRYEEARAMYQWLLERDAKDREALLALSRLDAWEGCYARAEVRYRKLLELNEHDSEARASLIDVLLWTGRWAEARTLIDVGLRLDPRAAELWQRRARLLQWTGDSAAAIAAAERAHALAPGDDDIRALRDQLFVGQVRTSLRGDFFPQHYADIYSGDVQAMQLLHKFELGVEAQLLERYGQVPAAPAAASVQAAPRMVTQDLLDGLYTASAIYHADGGAAVGLSLGFGAPARSIPWLETKAWGLLPLAGRWSGSLAYAFWQYHSDKTVHIIAPSLGYAITDDLLLELREWTSFVVAPPKTDWVAAAGVRATWRLLAPLSLGAAYTYGPQLDQAQYSFTTSSQPPQFLLLKSHVIGVFADWRLQRELGLQPMLAFEHRTAPSGAVALIYTAELASYFRW